MDDLTKRLEHVSRGRPVSVRIVPNSLLRQDFTACFQPDINGYVIELTEDGQFEEAYRFLERWIARDALNRDQLYEAPAADHVDFTLEGRYWMLERHSDQLFNDLEAAISKYCDYMENKMYYVPRFGDVVIEQRINALRGILKHFEAARDDIRRAVLSPHTVSVLQSADILPRSDAPH